MPELAFYGLIFALIFGVAASASAVAWSVIERRGRAISTKPAPKNIRSIGDSLLRSEALSTLSGYNVLLSQLSFVPKLKVLLQQASVDWSVGRVIAMMLLCGVLVLNFALRTDLVPGIGAVLLAAVAAAAPLVYLVRLRDKRYREIEEQLPEGLDYLSRAVVAGNSLPMSMELMADEVGGSLSIEVRKTVDEYNLGSPMEQVLRSLPDRLPMIDVQFFVSAVLTQSRTGGNLHDLLDTLSETIRERASLKGQVRAVTANGRLTAIILTALPLLIAGMMFLVNSNYLMVLVTNPLGKVLIFCAICAQVAAYFVINKIVDIEV